MSKMALGILLGLAAGTVDVMLMIPMAFPDKLAAMLGAFCSRFALGFFAGTTNLPLHPIFAGILIGVLTSLPDAIITKSYAPIMGTGIIFGALVGWALKTWART